MIQKATLKKVLLDKCLITFLCPFYIIEKNGRCFIFEGKDHSHISRTGFTQLV